MSRLKRLITEIHRRSLWQVLLVYLGVSWAILEAADLFAERFGLPDWLFSAALVLLIIGLVVILVLAFVPEAQIPRAAPEEIDRTGVRRRHLLTWRRATTILVVALATWGVVAAGWLWLARGGDETVRIGNAVAEIERLADDGMWEEAYELARGVEGTVSDSVLIDLWPLFSRAITIESAPSGAHVYRREFAATEADWEYLGTAPLDSVQIPFGYSRLRFELDGYRRLDITTSYYESSVAILDTEETLPGEMVRVVGGSTEMYMSDLLHLEPVELGDYFIDRYEVTNKEFREFVDAGGYRRPEYWKHPFLKDGRRLTWDEAMAEFTDRTGRPGPSTWEVGDYPDGEDDYPVTGVSWHEAAAYARFVGKALPTIYHWGRAAGIFSSGWVLPLSNFDGVGPAPVGRYSGMGPYGTFDMAGNVREWCFNETGDERYILGGAWNDQYWSFTFSFAHSPFDRSATNGFRLVSYLDDSTSVAVASRPIERPPVRDFLSEEPVSDEIFQVYRRLYSYDPAPLGAAIESADSTPDWIRERITFDAAYGSERVIAYLYLPRAVAPPYQTVVYFPGAGAIYMNSFEEYGHGLYDFIVKAGRAVLFPIYKSTFERDDELESGFPNESTFYREHVVQWAKDLGRSIDYLESRPDIDKERLAYFGYSWGGSLGPIMLALEPRLKVGVLYVAGFLVQERHPEADPINFVSRVTSPVLMLNGKYDFLFPEETSQIPLYRLLGTAAEHKRHFVYESGHSLPRTVLIRETLDWLDRYLGPVQ